MENLEDQLDNKINLNVTPPQSPKKDKAVEIETNPKPSRQLTEDEIAIVRKYFDLFEKNEDETITTDYLKAFLYQSEGLEESLKEVDPDNTRRINFQGLLQLYQKQDPIIEDKEVIL